MNWRLLLLIFLPGAMLSAQKQNLIPNPGFEVYEGFPLGWNYSGKDFSRILKHWNSPTSASPDVYGPDVVVPKFWQEQGFGGKYAPEGKSMVGITLFGCEDGKPHCREYLQTELYEPLIPGQKYRLRCLVNHLPRSLQVDKIGFLFHPKPLNLQIDNGINMDPQLVTQYAVKAGNSSWKELVFEFEANERAEYLIVGNFSGDAETLTVEPCSNSLPFAYYYFDDFSLEKIPPILEQPIVEQDLRLQTLEEGKVIQLHNIYFEFDKSELSPKSYVELFQLLEILKSNPNMEIEVLGHTDELGSDEYNAGLSDRRAAAVVNFLEDHGIHASRLQSKGFGSSEPIASNEDSGGRQLNRRVEFKILRM